MDYIEDEQEEKKRRGFFIPASEIDHKKHINLSSSAWLVIKEDMRNFGNGEKDNLTGFLNRVFENFYQDAEATISQRVFNRKEELKKMFSSSEFKRMDKKTTGIYITKILDDYKKN